MTKNSLEESRIPDADKGPVIVLGRQFGSGGRRIGQMLASRLGWDYYDKELLAEAAKHLGFSPDIFAANDEKRPSYFNSFLQGVYGIPSNFHNSSVGSSSLYAAQSEVIRKIGDKGRCVIVGRTADYVLRDHPGLLSIFLHSPIEHRAARIVERNDATTPAQAAELARRHDRDRENYYNFFTGRHWGHADNYHVSIDASLFSDEDIADMIINLVEKKKKKKTL
ncbi:MAG: cytidylate kinase-like family protein [Muribaculaceae bacterium]|nr:cytidylate kinase-like family protein [Muribaculaceae bacterium]